MIPIKAILTDYQPEYKVYRITQTSTYYGKPQYTLR